MSFTDISDYPVHLLMPARHEPWPNDDLGPLVKDIAAHGIKTPLLVADLEGNQIYTVINGNRRLRALKDLSIQTAPIRVVTSIEDMLANLPPFHEAADPKGITVPYWKREIAFGGIYRYAILALAKLELGKRRSLYQQGRKTPLAGFGYAKIIQTALGVGRAKLSRLTNVALTLTEKMPGPKRPALIQDLVDQTNEGVVSAEQIYDRLRLLGPIAGQSRAINTKVEDDEVNRMLNSLRVTGSFLTEIAIGDISNVSDSVTEKLQRALVDLRRTAYLAIKVLKNKE